MAGRSAKRINQFVHILSSCVIELLRVIDSKIFVTRFAARLRCIERL